MKYIYTCIKYLVISVHNFSKLVSNLTNKDNRDYRVSDCSAEIFHTWYSLQIFDYFRTKFVTFCRTYFFIGKLWRLKTALHAYWGSGRTRTQMPKTQNVAVTMRIARSQFDVTRSWFAIEYRTRIVTRRTFRRSSGDQEDRLGPITKLLPCQRNAWWISRFPCVTHPRTRRLAILFLRVLFFPSWYFPRRFKRSNVSKKKKKERKREQERSLAHFSRSTDPFFCAD